MTDAKVSKGPLRYRLYYRLMDLSLAVTVIGVAIFILMRVTGTAPSSLPLIIAYGLPIIVFLVNSIIVPVLITFSRLRDEYADILWRRTVAQLTVLTIWTVPVFSVVAWTAYLLTHDTSAGLSWAGNRPEWIEPFYVEEKRNSTVFAVWHFFTIGFVFLFQWNRWRDSR